MIWLKCWMQYVWRTTQLKLTVLLVILQNKRKKVKVGWWGSICCFHCRIWEKTQINKKKKKHCVSSLSGEKINFVLQPVNLAMANKILARASIKLNYYDMKKLIQKTFKETIGNPNKIFLRYGWDKCTIKDMSVEVHVKVVTGATIQSITMMTISSLSATRADSSQIQ